MAITIKSTSRGVCLTYSRFPVWRMRGTNIARMRGTNIARMRITNKRILNLPRLLQLPCHIAIVTKACLPSCVRTSFTFHPLRMRSTKIYTTHAQWKLQFSS